MSKISLFVYFPIIIIVALFVFYPTFKLALFGDDWYFFWRYLHFLGPNPTGNYNHLTYILTPYGSQEVLMGILRNFFDFNSTPYYLTSFLLRVVASFSILLPAYYLTKNKLAAFFAAFFFSITPIGLDTSNWVFNMTVYISITFFNICLYSILKFKKVGKVHFFLISLLAFYLAHVAAPNRMTGLFVFIILMELFFLLKKFSFKKIKFTLLELFAFLLVFLFLNITGSFPDSGGIMLTGAGGAVFKSFGNMMGLLNTGRFDFFFHPFLTMGEMVIPNTLFSFNNTFVLIPLFLIFLLINFFLLKSIRGLNTSSFKITSVIGFLLTIFSLLIYLNNKTTLTVTSMVLILVGFYTFTIFTSLYLSLRKDNQTSKLLFVGILWLVLSFIFTWINSPETVMPTTHRYLIVAAVGMAILFAGIISLGKNRKYQVWLFCFLSVLLIMHIKSSQIYIKELLNNHDQETSNKIWTSIPNIPEAVESEKPVVIYLQNDGTNGPILYNNLGFGLDYRLALLYNIHELDRTPVMMDDLKNVISAVTDGKSFTPYNYHALSPVPINNVYAFRLEGKDNLINITDEVRSNLVKIIK